MSLLKCWESKAAKASGDSGSLATGAEAHGTHGLSGKAMKSISRQRSVSSYSQFKDSKWWDELSLGLSCADGILKLDDVDVVTPEANLLQEFRQFSQGASEKHLFQDLGDEERGDVHHKACLAGECDSDSVASTARRLVWCMARMLKRGALALVD